MRSTINVMLKWSATTALLSFTEMATANTWISDANGYKFWSGGAAASSVLTVTWTGDCVDGYGEGDGTQEWMLDGVLAQSFKGELTRGKRTGIGIYMWANGDRYEGEFVDSQRTGKGNFIWRSTGAYYEGDFVNGQLTGQGTKTERNGATYTGGWLNGKWHGLGKIKWRDGTQLIAEFNQDNIINGEKTAADGTVIVTYVNGASSAAETTQPNRRSTTPSVATSLLGAVAQGAAASGGRNASQYQAIANALQNSSGQAVASSSPGRTESIAPIPTNASTPARKTMTAVPSCITQVRIQRGEPGYGGWHAAGHVETGIRNTCSFQVEVAWCVTGVSNAAYRDTSRCETQSSGTYGLNPSQQLSMRVDKFSEFRSLTCRSPSRPLDLKWNGSRFSGQCVVLD